MQKLKCLQHSGGVLRSLLGYVGQTANASHQIHTACVHTQMYKWNTQIHKVSEKNKLRSMFINGTNKYIKLVKRMS